MACQNLGISFDAAGQLDKAQEIARPSRVSHDNAQKSQLEASANVKLKLFHFTKKKRPVLNTFTTTNEPHEALTRTLRFRFFVLVRVARWGWKREREGYAHTACAQGKIGAGKKGGDWLGREQVRQRWGCGVAQARVSETTVVGW